MERLAREKIATQQRLAELKNELSQCMDVIEIDRVLRQTIQPEDDQASTSTASGTGTEDMHLAQFRRVRVMTNHFLSALQKERTTSSRKLTTTSQLLFLLRRPSPNQHLPFYKLNRYSPLTCQSSAPPCLSRVS